MFRVSLSLILRKTFSFGGSSCIFKWWVFHETSPKNIHRIISKSFDIFLKLFPRIPQTKEYGTTNLWFQTFFFLISFFHNFFWLISSIISFLKVISCMVTLKWNSLPMKWSSWSNIYILSSSPAESRFSSPTLFV